ncbi:sigma-70 family RNA polymerase sigma factor [Sphingomonas sp. CL5.1]|uniref:RNA polymerase sigma factor n=1 Tax=Sphingomonas sp. CL5.1 TaxID=2653203 RepID=UPI001583EB74|nr:sigma-70 family RNA polymerase sigma factor [Sphingomonas sp. CL5.1]QKR99607.1 sigma-70 family RNA polymerase sigma factor [Sphingomonas sp. CL5.1]
MRREAVKVIADLSVRFRPALMAFFLRRIHNFTEAEDLTQEVLLRVAQKSETLDTGRPDAYVFQIAANLLRDRARRSNVREAYLRGAAIIEEARVEERDPDRVLQGKQSLATVIAALHEMPERTRTIFILFRLENLKQHQIADMLGVSVRTVEQHVVRASLFLRQKFGEES